MTAPAESTSDTPAPSAEATSASGTETPEETGSGESTSSGQGRNLKIGTPLPFSNTNRLDGSTSGEGTVTLLGITPKDRCADAYCSIPDGKRIFSVQVTYQATSGEVPHNPADWSLIDVEGQQYSETFYQAVKMGQALPLGDVGEGRQVKGVVAFEIPRTVDIVSVDFSNIGDWKIDHTP